MTDRGDACCIACAAVGIEVRELENGGIRVFDRQLHARAVDAGVTIASGARVTDLATDRDGVTLSFAARPPVRARACILACGANYALQRRLGLGLPTVFLQSAQVEWPAARRESVEVHFGRDTAPGGFAWVVPVRRGAATLVRVGLMCDGNAGRHFHAFVDRVAERCGLYPQTVAHTLFGPPPANDPDLVNLAHELDNIERQVAQS